MSTALIPARMSLEDCMAEAQRARTRFEARERERTAIANREAEALAQRAYHGVYEGARMTRLEQDWITTAQAADDEVKRDLMTLRKRAREVGRNNPLAKQYLRLVDQNVVGPDGPMVRPTITDSSGNLSRFNKLVKMGWQEWSESCSLDGKLGFVDLQRIQSKGARGEGEILCQMVMGPQAENRYGFALQAIDPDQLDHQYNWDRGDDSNIITMGVERTPTGRIVGYHIYDEPYSWIRQRTRRFYPADEILHVYDPDRVNQSRGITDFHAVLLALHFLGQYSHYELVAARIGAAKPIIWKRIANDPLGAPQRNAKSTTGTEQPKRVIDELEPGLFGYAPEGFEPANVVIDHPSQAFDAFMNHQKRDISVGLGVGYQALTGDLSQTSFSSARTGTLLERDTWRTMQRWWIRAYVRPIYRNWLRAGMLAAGATGGRQGLVLDSRDFSRLSSATFTARGYDYVDPLKDANAVIALIKSGLWSRHRAAEEMGIDLEQIFDELKLERQMAEARQLSIDDPIVQERLVAAIKATSDPNAQFDKAA